MDCVFCKIVSGVIPSRFLGETAHSVSFLDAAPLAKGHVLVIPKNHRQKIQDMTDEETSDLFLLVSEMVSRVDGLAGASLVAIHNGRDAGQEIPHVHVHLIPRTPSDSAGPVHSMFDAPVSVPDSETDDLYNRLRI